MSIRETNCAIHWIDFYPVDSAIQRLNNRGQMSNDFQLQIHAGQEAQATVIAYADWLVTTINDALPQNNWTVPSPNPSTISIENAENLDTEEPEEWMLLCGLNQRYYDTISRGSQSHENLQFYWTETARAMPPHLLRESSSWITKRRNDTLENPPLGDKPVYAFPSQSSSLLAQHGHSIYGTVFLKQLLCYRKIFDRLETILRQNSFEQFSFAYEMVKPIKMNG